ncbi:GNAT family N-acetyltransferase [Planococcus lenghuensis]|uniref:GNAT family N-acetyltransferase n=1 Tax=Planococcus lenghuensis TaxID=2213202 RepID=A0A1Q2L3P7_9BACL|nr:GNAT family N-acetyltransferase [Planococcus lenghuensis]AQQ54502.1 GNAT family N-acetyltransferase [Planococcus lenghuensis]
METEFVKLTPEDLEELQQVARETFIETFRDGNTAGNLEAYTAEAFSLDQLTNELVNSNSLFYFLKAAGETAGYLKLNDEEAQTENVIENSLEIERLYVKEKFQGQGFGKAMIEQALEAAFDLDKRHIWLGVWEKNEKALQFYKKLGFEERGRHTFELGGDRQTDLLLVKEM